MCQSGYLNGEATIRYILATELDVDIIVPRIIQGIQDVKEAILLDHINVHNFAVAKIKKRNNYTLYFNSGIQESQIKM